MGLVPGLSLRLCSPQVSALIPASHGPPCWVRNHPRGHSQSKRCLWGVREEEKGLRPTRIEAQEGDGLAILSSRCGTWREGQRTERGGNERASHFFLQI